MSWSWWGELYVQWYAGKCLTNGFPSPKALISSVCQSLWCKYPQQDWCQTSNMTSPSGEQLCTVGSWESLQACASTLLNLSRAASQETKWCVLGCYKLLGHREAVVGEGGTGTRMRLERKLKRPWERALAERIELHCPIWFPHVATESCKCGWSKLKCAIS